METAMIPTPTREATRLPMPRLNLLDLIVIVLAAGLSSGLARGARLVWTNFPSSTDRAAGVATMVLAVWVCVPLARQALAWSRGGGTWRAILWPVTWRVAVAVGLASLAIEQGGLLRLGPDGTWAVPMQFPPRNLSPIRARFGLLPIIAALGLVGAILGMMPVRDDARPRRRGLPIRWLLVPLALVAGLLMAVVLSFVPHLILIAVDGVTTAFRSVSGHPLPDVLMRDSGTLTVRVDRTAKESLATLAVCAIAGMILASDLRRDLSAEPMTWRKVLPRIVLVVLMTAAGLRLVLVSASALHPSLYEGIALSTEPQDMLAIIGGFGMLAAGLAARAVSPRVPIAIEASRLRQRAHAVRTFVVLLLVSILVIEYGAFTPGTVGVLGLAQERAGEIQTWMTRSPLLASVMNNLNATAAVWGMVLAWLVWMVASINLRKPGVESAPFDSIGATWSRLAWFFWCALGLTVLCLAALPAFALGGIALENIRYRFVG